MAKKSADKTDRPKAERKPKADKPAKPTVEAMNADQRQALFIRHKRALAPLLNALAQAQAGVKQAYALAKAEGVPKDALEYARKLETDAGEATAIAKRAMEDEVALWSGVPIGGQKEMFDSAPNRHFADGKRAGAAGEPRKPPPQLGAIDDCEQWMAGWAEGAKAYDAISHVGRGAEAKAAFVNTIGG